MLIDKYDRAMRVIETDTEVYGPGTAHLAEEPKILCHDCSHVFHVGQGTTARDIR